jgi:hypothetical protein
MSNTRVTVIIRKDLQLSPGMLAAQAVHIAMEFISNRIDAQMKFSEFDKIQLEWIKTPYISILAVQCLEDLDRIIDRIDHKNYDDGDATPLPYHIWKDLVPSPTFPEQSIKATVGAVIGPADFDAIKLITGNLPSY